MGGLVTTPIINHPEVAIVGVNKMVVRPVLGWLQFCVLEIMNLFQARSPCPGMGLDAARFVQRIKLLLELPALIFID